MTTKEFAYAMVMGELNALPPDRRATITQSQIDDALAVTELQANSLAESFKSRFSTMNNDYYLARVLLIAVATEEYFDRVWGCASITDRKLVQKVRRAINSRP